ncbi:MAG TPA: hypothetical protein VGX68_00075 [Thermoanaerobaculia bacterium]|jgi:hypothetical protein|nr:hypothetical protein [Thermoanaerobaculia bacterium]
MIAEGAHVLEEAPDPAAVEQAVPESVPEWGLAKRILFRFICAYFFLYIFPFPLEYIPYVGIAAGAYQKVWNALVPWVGRHVFHVEITVLPNGSGDTTYNYVQVFCYLVLAAAATLVWTLLDRKRSCYARLHEWLRVYVRFFLGASMISYGAFKIIPSQFPPPTLDRLLQPFGDASPMGLLWTFVGASRSYESFTGAAELLGGLLLIARRTTLLGALICVGVASNIVMLNFSYDVPVKLYSSHLLLMAIFLVLPDARRLVNLFLFNRAAEPAEIRPLFKRRWLNWAGLALRTLLILGVAALTLFSSYQGYRTARAPKGPFYGIWNVEELVVDGQARPPLVSDESRWRRVVFEYPGSGRSTFAIQRMDQSRQRFDVKADLVKGLFELAKRDDPSWKSSLSFKRLGPDLLALEGTLDGQKVRASLRRENKPSFRLLDRGFHWINEYPFNK